MLIRFILVIRAAQRFGIAGQLALAAVQAAMAHIAATVQVHQPHVDSTGFHHASNVTAQTATPPAGALGAGNVGLALDGLADLHTQHVHDAAHRINAGLQNDLG